MRFTGGLCQKSREVSMRGAEYLVPLEKLLELMELCTAAHNSEWIESSTLLPTMPGPFFGSIDYDEHYYWMLTLQ